MSILSDTTGIKIRIAQEKQSLLARWKQAAEVTTIILFGTEQGYIERK